MRFWQDVNVGQSLGILGNSISETSAETVFHIAGGKGKKFGKRMMIILNISIELSVDLILYRYELIVTMRKGEMCEQISISWARLRSEN